MNTFLENNALLQISKTGRIRHLVRQTGSLKKIINNAIKNLGNDISDLLGFPSLFYKECGYHLFNLFAFSILYNYLPNNKFWDTQTFRRITSFAQSRKLRKCLESADYMKDATGLWKTVGERAINYYGYPYNVPGFEIDLITETFSKYFSHEIATYLLKTQIELTFNETQNLFGINCEDKGIINYRIYEYYLQYLRA
ncbi:MAG: hypothetical protein ABFC21_09020 [Rectinema sp.]